MSPCNREVGRAEAGTAVQPLSLVFWSHGISALNCITYITGNSFPFLIILLVNLAMAMFYKGKAVNSGTQEKSIEKVALSLSLSQQ